MKLSKIRCNSITLKRKIKTNLDVLRCLIGNPSAYIQTTKRHNKKTGKNDWSWLTKYDRITIELLKNHQKGEISIGTFPIYRQWHTVYSRFIAIDIDIHSDDKNKGIFGVNETLKKKASEKIELLYNESEKYFGITNDSILVEDSGGGFHIWIFIDEKTTLTNANVYVDFIRPRIQELFMGIDDDIEFFPKQTLERMKDKDGNIDLMKTPGNAIKLPFGVNMKRNHKRSRIIAGTQRKLKAANITAVAQKLKFRLSTLRMHKVAHPQHRDIEVEDKRDVLDVDLNFYYNHPTLKLCFKNIIDGSFKAHNTGSGAGNMMRVALSNELYYYNAPIKVIVNAFRNQEDFDPVKTKYHIKQCIKGIESKGNPLRFNCKSIKGLGYCDDKCYRLGNSKKETTPVDKYNSVRGWDGLHELNDRVVQESGKRYYYYKTTRSGTTTSVVIKGLQHKKKILMIAPLINIFKITVKRAILLGKENGMLDKYNKYLIHRLKSNFEVCEKIQKRFGSIPGIQDIFPFFHKGYCAKCSQRLKDKCEYQIFLEDLENKDLIYLTVKKFNAMIKGGDDSQKLLRRLLDWSDIVFVDECSHIFDADWDSSIIWQQEGGLTDSMVIKWRESIEGFIEQYPDWINSSQVSAMFDFIEFIDKKLDEIKDFNSPMYKRFNNEFADTLDIDKKISFYHQLIMFYKDTFDYKIKYLVDCFLNMSRKMIYLQLIVPLRDPKKVIMASVNDINACVDFLNNFTKEKLLLLTDATEPPIELSKCFDDLDYLYVNDPMNTADKQIIYVITNFLSFHKITSALKNEIIEVMDKYAINDENPVFLIAQSIRIKKVLLNIARSFKSTLNHRWSIKKIDYFRGKTTKGQPSPLRRMIVFGSARPPAHCYDYIAAIYRRAGYLKKYQNVGEAGKYLEMYSAQNAFFQTTSRVKCPLGVEQSSVIVYGCSPQEIEAWLKMKIATPKVISI